MISHSAVTEYFVVAVAMDCFVGAAVINHSVVAVAMEHSVGAEAMYYFVI